MVFNRVAIEILVKLLNYVFVGDAHRKISITLYKEDWIELVATLKEKLNRIIDNNNKYDWASNIKITHQLCSQKYSYGVTTFGNVRYLVQFKDHKIKMPYLTA